jgi:hypothetical protein
VILAIVGGIMLFKSPLLLVIGLFTVLLLLLDDYLTWKEGGNSLFGDKWSKIDDKITDVKNFFEWVFDGVDNAVDIINDLLDRLFTIPNKINEWKEKWQTKGTESVNNANISDSAKQAILGQNIFSTDILSVFKKTINSDTKKAASTASNYTSNSEKASKGAGAGRNTSTTYTQNINLYGNSSLDSNTKQDIKTYTKRMLQNTANSSVLR